MTTRTATTATTEDRAETLLVLQFRHALLWAMTELDINHNQSITALRRSPCGNTAMTAVANKLPQGFTLRSGQYYARLWDLSVSYRVQMAMIYETALLGMHARWLRADYASTRSCLLITDLTNRLSDAAVAGATPQAVAETLASRKTSLQRARSLDTPRRGTWDQALQIIGGTPDATKKVGCRPDAPTLIDLWILDQLLDMRAHKPSGGSHLNGNVDPRDDPDGLVQQMKRLQIEIQEEGAKTPEAHMRSYVWGGGSSIVVAKKHARADAGAGANKKRQR